MQEEDSGLKSLVQVKAQLRQKEERVKKLEENLVGKQLALDKVIRENEKLRQDSEMSQKVRVNSTGSKRKAFLQWCRAGTRPFPVWIC